MSDTWKKFDGYPIELYDGRFSGTFDMDEQSGEGIKHEQNVAFVVVAHADKAAISTNKDGEVKRTNTFKVQQVKVISGGEAETLLHAQGLLPQAEYHIEPEDATSTLDEFEGIADVMSVDPDTGEITGGFDPTEEIPVEPVFADSESEEEVFSPGQEPTAKTAGDDVLKDFLYGEDR